MSTARMTPSARSGSPLPQAEASRAARNGLGRSGSKRRRNQDHPYWFLIPALGILCVFFFVPTLFNFIYAFTDWSSFKAQINFVGFDNFVQRIINSSLLTD